MALAGGGGPFSPASLSPALWLEASDISTLFQSNAGTTPVATAGDPVGLWADKSGNGNHFPSLANDTTRPTYAVQDDLPCVSFDGSDDILVLAKSLGLYTGGACSVFVGMRSAGGSAQKCIFTERSSTDGNPLYQIWTPPADADDANLIIRNDAGAFVLAIDASDASDVFDGNNFVLGFTDDGSTVKAYENSALLDSDSYARSGSVTTDTTSLCGSYVTGSASSQLMALVFCVVVVLGRVISDAERAKLVTYIGTKIGMFL